MTGTSHFPPPSSAFQVKRATFKTLSNEVITSDSVKETKFLRRKAPSSFDVPEHTVDEHSSQDFQELFYLTNTQSPNPVFNPDMVLPTIALTQPASSRKPLMKQSSTTFLSMLKSKTALHPQLFQMSKSDSVDLPKRGKSAPNSPELLKTRTQAKNQDRSSVITSASESYSQGDVRIDETLEAPMATSRSGEVVSSNGSCVAERGGLSDNSSVLSGDFEMLSSSWGAVPSILSHDNSASGLEEQHNSVSNVGKCDEILVVISPTSESVGKSLGASNLQASGGQQRETFTDSEPLHVVLMDEGRGDRSKSPNLEEEQSQTRRQEAGEEGDVVGVHRWRECTKAEDRYVCLIHPI